MGWYWLGGTLAYRIFSFPNPLAYDRLFGSPTKKCKTDHKKFYQIKPKYLSKPITNIDSSSAFF